MPPRDAHSPCHGRGQCRSAAPPRGAPPPWSPRPPPRLTPPPEAAGRPRPVAAPPGRGGPPPAPPPPRERAAPHPPSAHRQYDPRLHLRQPFPGTLRAERLRGASGCRLPLAREKLPTPPGWVPRRRRGAGAPVRGGSRAGPARRGPCGPRAGLVVAPRDGFPVRPVEQRRCLPAGVRAHPDPWPARRARTAGTRPRPRPHLATAASARVRAASSSSRSRRSSARFARSNTAAVGSPDCSARSRARSPEVDGVAQPAAAPRVLPQCGQDPAEQGAGRRTPRPVRGPGRRPAWPRRTGPRGRGWRPAGRTRAPPGRARRHAPDLARGAERGPGGGVSPVVVAAHEVGDGPGDVVRGRRLGRGAVGGRMVAQHLGGGRVGAGLHQRLGEPRRREHRVVVLAAPLELAEREPQHLCRLPRSAPFCAVLGCARAGRGPRPRRDGPPGLR